MAKDQQSNSEINKIFSQDKELTISSGNIEMGDYDLKTDFDCELIGIRGSKNLHKMSKSDGIIGGIIKSFKNPLLSAKWCIKEIPDATPEEERAKDVLSDFLFKDHNFEAKLNSILNYLVYGFSCFEKYYGFYNNNNSEYIVPIMDERIQTSIDNIDYKNKEVTQIATRGNYVYIPLDELVFFTNEKQGDDLRGVSVLRNSYYNFIDKKEIKEMVKVGIRRNSLGVVVGKYNGSSAKNAKSLMKTCASYANISSTKDYVLLSGEDVDIDVKTFTFNPDQITNYLRYLDTDILISCLTQFLNLGQGGNGGSYNLGEGQSENFIQSTQYIADYVQTVLNEAIVKDFITLNFEGMDYNKFKIEALNIRKNAEEQYAKLLKDIKDSGFVTPTDKDEKDARQKLGLVELEDEDYNQIAKNKEIKLQPSIDEKAIKLSEGAISSKEFSVLYKKEAEGLERYMQANLSVIGDKLIRDIMAKVRKGKSSISQLQKVKPANDKKYKKGLARKMAGISNKTYKEAKADATAVIKLAEDMSPKYLPTKELTDYTENQSEFLVDDQTERMRNLLLLNANSAGMNGKANEEIEDQLNDTMEKFVNGAVVARGAELTVARSMNYGSITFYKEIDKEIVGYRVENANPKHPYCKSVVGTVFPKEELANQTPPYHYGCNSYLSPVYKQLEPNVEYDYKPSKTVQKSRNIF